MNFALIYDNSTYQFAQVLQSEKKFFLIRELNSDIEKKIKLNNLIYTFKEQPQQLIPLIEKINQDMDINLLWELSSDSQTWQWDELTNLYHGKVDTPTKLALFLFLTNPEIYFVYQGDSTFKRCNEDEIKTRQFQIWRQQEYQRQFDEIYSKLINLEIPDWDIEPIQLINKPDKNSLEYKAIHKVSRDLKLTIPEILFRLGYIRSVEELILTTFTKQYFPNGTQLKDIEISDQDADIPLNDTLKVFSIDDSTTTEIDDAFSLQPKTDGWVVGIHISAPALNHELLDIASERLSTVYYPGSKITMLPENVIKRYSLEEGKILPVVSIYFDLDQEFNILSYETKLERVKIEENLRTENLEQLFNSENLAIDHGYPYEKELKTLHQFALKLEEKRGRPSVNQLMVDYNFSFEGEKVVIKPRIRGNPIDKLVSELMILANCSWGRMLTNAFIPAIYRVKQPMQPVVMTLKPDSHTGLNVDYYTWASSPLRRAVDLINQSQIISLIRQQKPLTATDYAMANIVEHFDETYSAYLKFQDSLERYWSLRFLQQENLYQIEATYTFRNNVQLTGVPITIDMSSQGKTQPAGTVITLAIDNINLINQTFDYKLITTKDNTE